MVCCFVVTHLNSTRQAASRHHQSSVSLLKCISADSSSFEERRVSFDQQDIEVSFRYRSGKRMRQIYRVNVHLKRRAFQPCLTLSPAVELKTELLHHLHKTIYYWRDKKTYHRP
mmetsp:Transcript_28263/g.47997  ORF Transcript_28263/g.47997 Transcript_28263/m.47997 type:complete len:114 (-) Transcript_28263:290-631(-)